MEMKLCLVHVSSNDMKNSEMNANNFNPLNAELTLSRLMTYIYIYIYIYICVSYRTANLQKLHFIYLFNKCAY